MEQLAEQDGSSLDVVKENLEALKAIFPEAFTEDGVDFEVLRQLLGDAVDEGEEKYGLNWHGKKKARQIGLMPSLGTLRPCPEESVDWDTTQNLFIEGDNLEVLKLLQKSYAGKVKMIYIDPPYNTGKEFIYPDKYQDNLDTYLKYTGQKDDEGFMISSNKESSGRYHTNWMNMIYPRLKLAKNLLKDEGVIFISIDDYEQDNLKLICDEVYGEENFIEKFIWIKKTNPPNNVVIGSVHEYVLAYSKNSELCRLHLLPRDTDSNSKYKNPDNDPRGPWVAGDLSAAAKGGRSTPSLLYQIENPMTGEKFDPPPGRMWIVAVDQMKKNQVEGRIFWGNNGKGRPKYKRFLSEVRQGFSVSTLLNFCGNNGTASKELNSLFDGEVVFETPKPTSLIDVFCSIATKEDDISLDFFAGSAPLSHSIIKANLLDAGNRRHISVQLPEPCNESSPAFKLGLKTIADIGKERIRRAAAKIKEENPEYEGDLGFKVFKLDSSNIRAWNPDRNDLEQTLLDHMEHLIEGRSEEDVLYELLLKRGVDLTVPIEEKTITGKTVYSIGYGVLFACLDTAISREEVEDIAQGIIDWHKELEPAGDTQVVFRDSAFANDIAKTNMTAILEQHGIAHVRSL